MMVKSPNTSEKLFFIETEKKDIYFDTQNTTNLTKYKAFNTLSSEKSTFFEKRDYYVCTRKMFILEKGCIYVFFIFLKCGKIFRVQH